MNELFLSDNGKSELKHCDYTSCKNEIAGRVELYYLFLQRFRRYLYKAELMVHSCPIGIGNNAGAVVENNYAALLRLEQNSFNPNRSQT